MFDLSWMELLFVAVLALIVIGPKDLPALFRTGGKLMAKGRRMYKDMLGSISQLEREVDMASGKTSQPDEQWRQWLPEEVRNLPADFTPGSMSAEQHAERRRQLDQARQSAMQSKEQQP